MLRYLQYHSLSLLRTVATILNTPARLYGRESQLEELSSLVGGLANDGSPLGVPSLGRHLNSRGVVVLRGPLGSGKSVLAHRVESLARGLGLRVLTAAAVEGDAPFSPVVRALRLVGNRSTASTLHADGEDTGAEPGVDELFLFHLDGTLLNHTTRRLRPDVSGSRLREMLEVVQEQAIAGTPLQNWKGLTIFLAIGQRLIAAGVTGRFDPLLRLWAQQLVATTEERFAAPLEQWTGDVTALRGIEELVDQLLPRRNLILLGEWARGREEEAEALLDGLCENSAITEGGARQTPTPTPTLLLIDDAEALDRGTIALLQTHLGDPVPRPLLVVLVMRVDDVLPTSLALRELSSSTFAERVTILELLPLRREDVATWVATVIGHPNAPTGFIDALYAQTGGSPLFVHEYLRVVTEFGQPVLPGSSAESALLRRWDSIQLPSSVRELIEVRLHQLTRPQREVLQYAAVAGRSFKEAVLVRAHAREDVPAILRSLTIAGHLVDAGEGRWRFEHDLMRRVVLDGLSGGMRRLLHRRIARALLASPSDPEGSVLLAAADHYSQTKEFEEIVEYSLRAAEISEQRYSPEEALRHYTHALEAARRLELLRLLPSIHHRIALLQEMGGEWQAAGEHYELSLQGLWDEDRATMLDSLRGLARTLSQRQQEDAAKVCIVEALLRADEGEHPRAAVAILSEACKLYRLSGDFRMAVAAGSLAVERARTLGDPQTTGMALRYLGAAFLNQGRFDSCLEAFSEAEAHLWQAEAFHELNQLYNNISAAHASMGDWSRAQEYNALALEGAERLKDLPAQGLALANGAEIHAQLGDLAIAESLLHRARAMGSRIGDTNIRVQIALAEGIVSLLREEPGRAEEVLTAALEEAEEASLHHLAVQLLRQLGSLFEQSDRMVDALGSYERAIDTHRRMGGGLKGESAIADLSTRLERLRAVQTAEIATLEAASNRSSEPTKSHERQG